MTDGFREHLRLSAIEVKRIVWHKNFLLIIGLTFLFAYNDLFWITPSGDLEGLIGLVSTTQVDKLFDGIISGVASASALAIDTQAGFVGLVLTRNVRRRDYLLHKAIAIFTVGALATIIRNLWLLGMGAMVLPWTVPGLSGCLVEVVDKRGGYDCFVPLVNRLKDAPDPFPAFYLAHPVLHDGVRILMTAFGTGVFALSGMLVAVCGGSVYHAIAIPAAFPLVVRFAAYGLPAWTRWLEPTNVLGFNIGERYFRMLPGLEYRLGIWIAYWIGLAILFVGLSLFIAEKRELALKEHGA